MRCEMDGVCLHDHPREWRLSLNYSGFQAV